MGIDNQRRNTLIMTEYSSSDPPDKPQAPVLRPYQVDAIGRTRAEMAAGRRRVLLTAPTGAGKTVIAAAMMADTVGAGGGVLFLAHRRELISQCSRKLHDLGVDHGILLPGHPLRLAEPVQIASIQTLYARAVRSSRIALPPASLVVLDEAHHAPAGTYRRILEQYADADLIGLTATPCRGDGRGLGSAFDVISECRHRRRPHAGSAPSSPATPDPGGRRDERHH
jgi:DNA repair protein RadD